MPTVLRWRPTSSCLPPVSPRGFAPRTPRHALSLAASPARSARVARSRGSLATPLRLRPSDFPTRPLARRFAGSLRARGSLARLARLLRYTLSLGALSARSARVARSRSSRATPLTRIRQHEQIQAGEQEEGEREQRRIGHPGGRHPTSPCQRDEVRDDGHGEGDGQPAVSLPDPAVPIHWDLR